MNRAACLLAGVLLAPLVTAQVDHSFSWSVVQANGDFAIDITVSTPPFDQWNAANMTVRTYSGVTIVSPIDNTPIWAPPVPDFGTTYDTYLRSPSALNAAPSIAGPPLWTPTSIDVAWLDIPGFAAPPTFLAARIALDGVGAFPGINDSGDGSLLASIVVTSIHELGSGATFTDTYSLYDGVPEPASALLLGFGVLLARRRR